MVNSFTIDKVGWHTSTVGNTEPYEKIAKRFFFVEKFLQKNGLTNRKTIQFEHEIDDTFEINSADLTELGLDLMKSVYDKWLRKVDRGMDPADVSMLERALKNLEAARSAKKNS